jgi:hypothetical protein
VIKERNPVNTYLLVDEQQYKGRYVTTCGPDSKEVISAADTPREAYDQAKATGCDRPVLLYVPEDENATYIY